ncbi:MULTISPECIES: FAD-dependent monooxygenase [Stenotrophomonas]|uniref:Monooxygenase n=1 Tax=Stenotrophomonas maltophilia TaxID=40324 RepID=A0A3S0JSZ1_STEMA|nr:FAD-dependent monooxygenase [Stenotrophomonas maltophilia]RTQ90499.1 monooxygenase [Stenotrophomonas maltophilia]
MEIGILGGGIAGLSAALALHRQGHSCRVYERRAGPSTMGAGVTLWPNAGFVLQELGLLEDIGAVGGRPTSVHRKDAVGDPLGGLNITLLDQMMGYPTHTILRRDLQAVLLDHVTRTGIQVMFGHRAVAIEQEDNGKAIARFDNGQCVRPDLVLGADGRMDSVARRFVAGDSRPIYQGFVNWIGVAQGRALVSEVGIQDYWGAGDRFGCVAIRTDLVYWAAAQARPLPTTTPAADMRDEVRDLFAGWPEPVARLIEATPAHSVQRIAVHDLEPLHTWSRANVLLIGDAAHAPLPTSGQGACQALEDAWHLARCLEGAESCLEGAESCLDDALPRFAALRTPKTTKLAEQGRMFARGLFAKDPETCRIRNERTKASDQVRDALAMAAGWSQGLPMAERIEREAANSAGSMYRL